jgi:anaerobic magnesium-protoporphyrin IX monomethyl ester cyclase
VNVLLLSMPDSFEHMPAVAIRMPNGALSSLAGNVDPHHRVRVADLVLVQDRVRQTIERLVREEAPDVIGLSVMTFQRRTAKRIIELLRTLCPRSRIVVGGYDPSLAPEAYTDGTADVIVHGEGDVTFRELLRALENGTDLASVQGLSWRSPQGYRESPPRPVGRLVDGEIRPPRRDARVLEGYTFLGRPVDVVETSRGCTFDCSFCSIIELRGRNFHSYDFSRVLADIADARDHGARTVFIVDDNITLDVRRFEGLCHALVDAGLDDLDYIVQAMTSSIAAAGATLAPAMRRAGFRYVFLGIENVLDEDLGFLRAKAKNKERGQGTENATLEAVRVIRRSGMFVVGGLIVGNPTDTPESIEANLAFARAHVDWPYIQHPTPYPRTPLSRDLRARGLVMHDRLEEYDGTTAVVRSEHLAAEEIEFLRWRAERWMKLRHFPQALRHSPAFCFRHGAAMIRHTFRGCSWRTFLGLEDEREAFARYRRIRAAEREAMWGPPAPDSAEIASTVGTAAGAAPGRDGSAVPA